MLGNASTPPVTGYPPMTNISLLEEGILAAVHRCPGNIRSILAERTEGLKFPFISSNQKI